MRIITTILSTLLFIACRANPFSDTSAPFEKISLLTSKILEQTDDGILEAFTQRIDASHERLNCIFSQEPAQPINTSIESARGRGVEVQLITPQGPRSGQMRHNFCIADTNRLIFASAPLRADRRQTEPMIAFAIDSTQGIVQEFSREFNLFAEGAFGKAKSKTDFSNKFTILDQVINLWWGPQENPIDELSRAALSATSSLQIYSTALETTHDSNDKLDLPTILGKILRPKNIAVSSVFSTQALYSGKTKAFVLESPKRFGTISTATTNLFIIDRSLASARTFIYSGSIALSANSVDDGVLIELKGREIAETLGLFLDQLNSVSVTISNIPDAAYRGAVAISEVAWMGSYSNAGTSDGDDEFVELYNNTSTALNLSGWKINCTTDAASAPTTAVTLPGGVIIAPNGFLVIARKNTGAFAAADLTVETFGFSNATIACQLMNGIDNAPIDNIGDSIKPFDTIVNFGTNDSTNRIRRSMERLDVSAPGTSAVNWKSSSENSLVAPTHRESTFATPGASNSPTTAITLINPSFENLSGWTSLTPGTLLFDSTITPHHGARTVHYNALTSSISGREFQSECLPATAVAQYAASIYELAPQTNAASVWSSIKLWWYADENCGSALAQNTESQRTVAPTGLWNQHVYMQTSPANTRSLRVSIRSRYATQGECGGCMNAGDTVYFDSAALSAL